MVSALEFLNKAKFPVIFVVLGFVLIVLSFSDVSDFPKISTGDEVTYPVFLTGIGFIVVSIAGSILMYLTSEGLIGWSFLSPSKIVETENGFRVPIGRAAINVIYGRIEDYGTGEDRAVVALPANEYFDDDCIRDQDSALGAYMQSKFPGRIDDVQKLVGKKLKSVPYTVVEKTPSAFDRSYGVGRAILLDNLNGSLGPSRRIVLAAVTQQRAGQGLKARVSFIVEAVKEIYSLMVDHRLRKIYSPIMGTGHGCMKTEVALFTHVLAWSEALCEPQGPDIEVNLVLFKPDDTAELKPDRRTVKQILQMATGMFET